MMENHLTCTSEDPHILSDLEKIFEVFDGSVHWATGTAHMEGAAHTASFLSAKIHCRGTYGRRGAYSLCITPFCRRPLETFPVSKSGTG